MADNVQKLIDQVAARLLEELEAEANLSEEELQNQTSSQIDINKIIDEVSCEIEEETLYSTDELEQIDCEPDLGNPLEQNEFETPEIPDSDISTDKLLECQKELDKMTEETAADLRRRAQIEVVLYKLKEFRDNILVFDGYYKARTDSMAKVIGMFQPLLQEIKDTNGQIATVNSEIDRLSEIYAEYPSDSLAAQIQRNRDKVDSLNARIERIQAKIQKRVESDDVFNMQSEIGKLTGDITNTDIRTVFRQTLGSTANQLMRDGIRDYSNAVDLKELSFSYGEEITLSKVANRGFLSLRLDFIALDFIEFTEDVFDKETGERYEVESDIPIRNSPYLTDNSFFNNDAGVDIRDKRKGFNPTGVLYSALWNKYDDPISNFFTLSDRGLTDEESLIDPDLVDTGVNSIREDSKTFFIQDAEQFQNFYSAIDAKIQEKELEIRQTLIEPALERAQGVLENAGRKEVKTLLAAGRIDQELIDESSILQSVLDSIEKGNDRFRSRLRILNEQIERLEQELKVLKKDPEALKAEIQKLPCYSGMANPLDEEDENKEGCDARELLGSDPIGRKTIPNGPDQTMPTAQRFCWWLEHSKILNKIGLTPIPDDSTKFRYWPVGLLFTSPAGKLIKIPLPIVWIPIIVVPTPFGILVTYVTACGTWIMPFQLFIKATGGQQFLITSNGPSGEFGYDGEIVKDTIMTPLSVIASREVTEATVNPDKFKTKFPNGESIPELPNDSIETRKAEFNALLDDAKKRGDEKAIKRYKKELDDISDFENPIPDSKRIADAVDKAKGVQDFIKDVKNKIAEKIDEFGNPAMEKLREIQLNLQERQSKLQAELVEARENTDLERVDDLKAKLNEIDVTIDEKTDAIVDGLLSYIDDVIDFPTLVIPKDKSKINPKQTARENFKDIIDEMSSDNKIQFNTKDSFNLKTKITDRLSEISERIDTSDLTKNAEGKINIRENLDKIKTKMKSLTGDLFNSIQGIDSPNATDEERERNARNRTSLSVTAAVLAKASELSIFDAFKPCCKDPGFDLEGEESNIPTDVASTILAAGGVVNGIIDGLDSSYIEGLYGNASAVSEGSIKSIFKKTLTDLVPDIPLPASLDVFNLGSLTSFLQPFFSSMSIPQAQIDAQRPILNKSVKIDLNIIKAPLKGIVSEVFDINGLPSTDILQLEPVNFKVYLKKITLDNVDDLLGTIEPFFALSDRIKTGNGVQLSQFEKAQQSVLPSGAAAKAKFLAKTAIQFNTKPSTTLKIPDLGAIETALNLMAPLELTQKANPVAYLPYVAMAKAGQQDLIRRAHPILNADELVPWERLTDKNFLLVLLMDEWITIAADNTGYYRRYL